MGPFAAAVTLSVQALPVQHGYIPSLPEPLRTSCVRSYLSERRAYDRLVRRMRAAELLRELEAEFDPADPPLIY